LFSISLVSLTLGFGIQFFVKGISVVSPNPGLLSALLRTGKLSGLLRWKVTLSEDQIVSETKSAGWQGVWLDTTGARTQEQFIDLVVNALSLNKYAKGSLVEFEVAFRDYLAETPSTAVFWVGWQDLIKHNKSDAQVLARIIEDVIEATSSLVLVVGTAGSFPEIGELSLA